VWLKLYVPSVCVKVPPGTETSADESKVGPTVFVIVDVAVIVGDTVYVGVIVCVNSAI
jgi:hypothetical protein